MPQSIQYSPAIFHKGYVTFQHTDCLNNWVFISLLKWVPHLSHDITELKQTLTSKALQTVKAASLLDTHQRSPSRVQKTENSTNTEPRALNSAIDRKGESHLHEGIFLDAMLL